MHAELNGGLNGLFDFLCNFLQQPFFPKEEKKAKGWIDTTETE